MVAGHVDGIGTILTRQPDSNAIILECEAPKEILRYCVPKGSITVDGISLTIASLEPGRFAIQVVPYTLSHTTLQRAAVGGRVNLECDMVGKYVVRAATLGALTAGVNQPAETGKVS